MTDQFSQDPYADTPFTQPEADAPPVHVPSPQAVAQPPQTQHADDMRPVNYASVETEVALRAAIELIERARPMPMSASSIVNKNEVLELLNAALARLPNELREARWLLKEREDFLVRVQGEGDALIAQARSTAQQMVQRTELVKTANEHAQKVVTDAQQEAKTLRLQTEDWCDQQLGRLEIALDRISKVVTQGRLRLQGSTQEHDLGVVAPIVTREELITQEQL